ncbi:2'-5' RNA ligase family protein [Neptunicella sp. SCSIO 80796]|uniref:2'-5' RNA ligase family protein n=1 Tax=Neptunicella plasticusilytica TaxID=3117012 RepID=UPI003A4DAAAF
MEHIYRQMWQEAQPNIHNNNLALDHLIDSVTDRRYGLTLVIRPSDAIKQQCQLLLEKLKHIEPQQYYYPAEDMHITLLSIISCYEGFRLDQINTADYIEVINRSIKTLSPFKLQFKGVTASSAGVLLQGFSPQTTLNDCRATLRQNFKKSTLQQSIDTRYELQTAHSTVVRFRRPLNNPNRFIQVLEQYKNIEFGQCEIKHIELVGTDWYHRMNQVKLIKTFGLNHLLQGIENEYQR